CDRRIAVRHGARSANRNRGAHERKAAAATARPQRNGSQSEEWRRNGSHRPSAGRNRVEPQTSGHSVEHQLQGAALQDSPIRYPSAASWIGKFLPVNAQPCALVAGRILPKESNLFQEVSL